MKRCIGVVAIAALAAACHLPLRPAAPGPSSSATPTPSVAAPRPEEPSSPVRRLAAAVAADARVSDHESDLKIRDRLAAEAARDAEACLALAPQDAACLYSHGLALGLDARVHPLHANGALKTMLGALEKAEAAEPAYDEAGPARVGALVLIRAPGWPLGPGDPDAGLAAARRAVKLRPRYPPNVLALAEASAKTGDSRGAQEAYRQARELSQAMPQTSDRDEWLREAEQALGGH